MNIKCLSRLMITILLLLVSCTTQATQPLARQALVNFLDHLHNGRYDEAIQLYGGSYETMVDHNPDIDIADHAALIKNACEINGAQCLEVKSTALEAEISSSEFKFKVEFLNADGTLFVRGPCCGNNETDTPSESSFIFSVIKDNEGKFVVMDMPPYVP